MDQPFDLLIVCSANVCRSPVAAILLERWAEEAGCSDVISVKSAGVAAFTGDPLCPQAATKLDVDPFRHAAREVTPHMLIEADLILAVDREVRGATARLVPSRRPRLFTLRQASALGIALAPHISDGTLPDGAPPLPEGTAARLSWLVGELDAGRGMLAARPERDADIADRHGPASHGATLAEVAAAVAGLTSAFDACLKAPVRG
jgi:protein-tyrosine phosphatase